MSQISTSFIASKSGLYKRSSLIEWIVLLTTNVRLIVTFIRITRSISSSIIATTVIIASIIIITISDRGFFCFITVWFIFMICSRGLSRWNIIIIIIGIIIVIIIMITTSIILSGICFGIWIICVCKRWRMKIIFFMIFLRRRVGGSFLLQLHLQLQHT